MRRFSTVLFRALSVTAFLFIGLLQPAQAQSSAAINPALWTITDEDSTIYLFGTVHILNPEVRWRTPAIHNAFRASDSIVFEAPADTSDPAKTQALVFKYGLNPQGQKLTNLMSPESKQLLVDVLGKFNMAGAISNFEPLRPWLVGVSLAGIQIQANGGDPNAGVERILQAEAQKLGKTILYLETDEQQLQIFANLSPEAELFFLEDGLKQMKEKPDQLDELVTYWQSGNTGDLAGLLVDGFSTQPEFYNAFLTNRNRDWANQIEEMLAGSGKVFVAVGAAHLVGDDSVQAFLKAKGIEAVRQ